MLLELSDGTDTILDGSKSDLESTDDVRRYNRSLNPFEDEQATTSKSSRFSFNDVKRLIKHNKREKQTNGMCLKITTARMRCSIKVKEEFENNAGKLHNCIIHRT